MEYPVIVANGGPLDGQQWVLTDHILIGRGEDCDIVINDRQVSRHHTLLEFNNGLSQIEDLGSKNGTYVNGEKVIGFRLLHEKDEIQIALFQLFIFLGSDATLPLTDFPPEMQNALCLRVDENSKRVWVRGVEIEPAFSAQQFALLAFLTKKQGQVVSREAIIQAVWGDEANWVTEQALDALVRRLRERLNQTDPGYDYIVTVRGHGLRLENNPH
ncbi:MAG: FHA domain-containing protein [Anaerolineaceae bacterium]|nr:FHA domain-containing protein [Anaerolineaceae bacterium]